MLSRLHWSIFKLWLMGFFRTTSQLLLMRSKNYNRPIHAKWNVCACARLCVSRRWGRAARCCSTLTSGWGASCRTAASSLAPSRPSTSTWTSSFVTVMNSARSSRCPAEQCRREKNYNFDSTLEKFASLQKLLTWTLTGQKTHMI